ncbi:hypothetical protein SAMN05660493_02304 [Epilithonimonas bovis DSM 19482]|uniref:Uncharacterized protein n=1 Tax=Epilithonimonas bovis DSM 19482 TaxID=1121284 RepID=A0A1U7PZS9_9FLAO|nr:hypothetical protein [Epilithonimonas bovis]SIT97582.1 hypothetical protein SAMN05660493_02304 [Epilithonimonas bovis DSM 19482]
MDEIVTNNTSFSKSKDATFLLRSQKLNAGIYFNPKQWKTVKADISPIAEYTFQDTTNQSYGVFVSEKAPIQTLKNLKDLIISNVQKRASFFRLISSEYRTLNGIKVLYLDYSANFQGMDFHYLANYYLTEEGYAGVFSYTFENLFLSSRINIEDLINGLVKTEKSKVTEVNNYTTPPPPITTKK